MTTAATPLSKQTKKRWLGVNKPYEEESRQEFEGVHVKYTRVYYKNFEIYFEGFNTTKALYKRNNALSRFYEIVPPIDDDYIKNACNKIKTVSEIKPNATRNVIIGMTISVTIAKGIVKAAKEENINEQSFFNDLYQQVLKQFTSFKVINAYVSYSKNMLVITGIPYLTKKKKVRTKTELVKYVSYTKLALHVMPRLKLAQIIMKKISEQSYFDNYRQSLKAIGTPEWRQVRLREAIAKDDLSYAALGLYVQLLFAKDPTDYNNKHLKLRHVEYTKNRSELVSKGYIITVRPSNGAASINPPRKSWKLLVF